jgi:hypothetical protein
MVKEATSLKMEKPIMDRLRIEAKKQNRSINNYMETILIQHFAELDAKQQEKENPGE